MRTTNELIEEMRSRIKDQFTLELESDLPDVNCAMTSLDYAKHALDKVWSGNSPDEFMRRYIQVLENRFSRLLDEDSGEYGSGRAALGFVIYAAEELSPKIAQAA